MGSQTTSGSTFPLSKSVMFEAIETRITVGYTQEMSKTFGVQKCFISESWWEDEREKGTSHFLNIPRQFFVTLISFNKNWSHEGIQWNITNVFFVILKMS